MISTFIDEVIAKGIKALLPQNLEDKWFEKLYNGSVEFLKGMADEKGNPDIETFLNNTDGMILLAATAELIQFRYDYPAHFQIETIPKEHLFESISCYSIAILIEKFKKENQTSIKDLDEDDILNEEKLFLIEKENLDLSIFLHNII